MVAAAPPLSSVSSPKERPVAPDAAQSAPADAAPVSVDTAASDAAPAWEDSEVPELSSPSRSRTYRRGNLANLFGRPM
jgi:hypothetical protein